MENSISGLPLREPTPAGWVEVATSDLDSLLNDHAQCELKAASTALSIAGRCAENSELVQSMTTLAHEEMRHFERVHRLILERGKTLQRVMEDPYVRELRREVRPGQSGGVPMLDQLILSTFIEARSCERFRLLSEAESLPDSLRSFYRELAAAEDKHHELFLKHAVELAGEKTARERLEEVAEIEAKVIRSRPLEPRMH